MTCPSMFHVHRKCRHNANHVTGAFRKSVPSTAPWLKPTVSASPTHPHPLRRAPAYQQTSRKQYRS